MTTINATTMNAKLSNFKYAFFRSKEQRKIALNEAIQYNGYYQTIQELLSMYKKLKNENIKHDIKSILFPYEFTLTQQTEIYCDELQLFIK